LYKSRLNGLESVDLGITNFGKSKSFYIDTWLLPPASETDTSVYLRGCGSQRHILALDQHTKAEVLWINFSSPTLEDLEEMKTAVVARGSSLVGGPVALVEPGDG